MEIPERPVCDVCGQKMYVYRRDADGVRFRCAAYPKCRTYKKMMKE